jgi:riboflavin kinase / FMN adenylyltransferase
MQIINDVRTTAETFPNVVLTIGSFDGIHLGHRRIIDEVVRTAREIHGTAALMSLRPHPREFFSPNDAPNILLSDAKKETLLAEAGIDVLYILPFDADTARMSPREFVEEIVLGRCHATTVIVGHDFCFGNRAAGDFEFLSSMAAERGFAVCQVPQLVLYGERVSSTLIREYILQGELEQVERFLGRKYSMTGEVVTGRGMGTKLGYPTANLSPHHSAVPAHGVYVAEAIVDGQRYPSAVNIGVAPTVRNEDIIVEAFLLDFAEDIVGKSTEVVFHKRLRPEKKFASFDELIVAIGRDVAEVRQYFAEKR